MTPATKTAARADVKSRDGGEVKIERSGDDLRVTWSCTTVRIAVARVSAVLANLDTVTAFGSDVWMEERDDDGRVFAMRVADGRFIAGRYPDDAEAFNVPRSTFLRAIKARAK